MQAIEKLTLNDASVEMSREHSVALGYGFRCGFLGMLHLDVFCERLAQEYNADVIITTPTVPYRVALTKGQELTIQNPSDFPLDTRVTRVQEPTVQMTIVAPEVYTGSIMKSCTARRGALTSHSHLSGDRVLLQYIMGKAELAENFFSELKSITRGFATMDYKEGEYRDAEMQRLDLLVNGDPVDAFTRIVHK